MAHLDTPVPGTSAPGSTAPGGTATGGTSPAAPPPGGAPEGSAATGGTYAGDTCAGGPYAGSGPAGSATGGVLPAANIRAHASEVAHDATELLAESRALVVEAYRALDIPGRMTRHPYQTVLVAAGIGYVLGGGLFTSLTSRLLRGGVRLAALPLVKQELLTLAETAVGPRPATP